MGMPEPELHLQENYPYAPQEKLKPENCTFHPEQISEVQTIYFKSMVHELNNFLQVIHNGMEMAKIQVSNGDKEIVIILEDCLRASVYSRRILENYSMFLKEDATFLNCTRTDLVELARESARVLLKDSCTALHFETGNPVEYVYADETQIRQVLHNLLKNAEEAVRGKEGASIKIAVSREGSMPQCDGLPSPEGYVKIKISDNGAGIGEDDIKHIFDPWFTTKKTGTGLGLSICQKIIRNHKGYITVDSEPDRGTVFTLVLPASRA